MITIMKEKSNEQIAMRVSMNTIIGNVALSAFKLVAGIIGNSAAMLSDAVHSLSDVLSTFIVMIGVKLSNKKADKEHPYGHERFECVTALILAAILCVTGAGIGFGGIKVILAGNFEVLPVPSVLPLTAAVVSIVVKEGMYWYTKVIAKKINSSALMANAWHHRSDALSSIGSFAGILGARLGFPALDPIAGIIICVFILKASFDIFRDAVSKMTDRACDDKIMEEIRGLILAQKNVRGIDSLQTRLFGDKIYVDVEIKADGDLSLREGHEIAQNVHDAIEGGIDNIKHCMVHVNPA